ncbi:alpha/beta fold hydrolase [Aquimarina sp. 2-A2]|uniref:alpha/beta fold hydrolase n=1 Tax=Aquimarina sp. 2-A2 TaxID=3382644 RepID=UPI00387EF7C5
MGDVLKRNNVQISGKGEQPMLFVHGFGCDQNMWRLMVPSFDEDYKIVLIDLVGAGDSILSAYHPEKYASLHGYAQDVVEVCQVLNLKEVIFVGHSVSAMIGALADIQAPGLFSKLIMIGPSPCYINNANYVGGFDRKDIEELLETMESNYLGWSAALAPSIMGNSDRPELGEELTESFCKMEPTIAQHFARVTFLSDNRKDLKNVKAHSLIIQCSDDMIAPEVVGMYTHQAITNSEYKKINAIGHCPHMSAPTETTAAIRQFLSK